MNQRGDALKVARDRDRQRRDQQHARQGAPRCHGNNPLGPAKSFFQSIAISASPLPCSASSSSPTPAHRHELPAGRCREVRAATVFNRPAPAVAAARPGQSVRSCWPSSDAAGPRSGRPPGSLRCATYCAGPRPVRSGPAGQPHRAAHCHCLGHPRCRCHWGERCRCR